MTGRHFRLWHICDLARSESEGRIQPGSGHWLRERPMDAKAKRKVIANVLVKLQRDMDMAVE